MQLTWQRNHSVVDKPPKVRSTSTCEAQSHSRFNTERNSIDTRKQSAQPGRSTDKPGRSSSEQTVPSRKFLFVSGRPPKRRKRQHETSESSVRGNETHRPAGTPSHHGMPSEADVMFQPWADLPNAQGFALPEDNEPALRQTDAFVQLPLLPSLGSGNPGLWSHHVLKGTTDHYFMEDNVEETGALDTVPDVLISEAIPRSPDKQIQDSSKTMEEFGLLSDSSYTDESLTDFWPSSTHWGRRSSSDRRLLLSGTFNLFSSIGPQVSYSTLSDKFSVLLNMCSCFLP